VLQLQCEARYTDTGFALPYSLMLAIAISGVALHLSDCQIAEMDFATYS
jgi:hypothetical protein